MLALADLPDAAVTFVAAALLPVVVAVVAEPDRAGRVPRGLRVARGLALPAGAGVVASALVARGTLAVALLAPYVAVVALLALHGASRVLARGLRPASELAIAAGPVFAAGAATWLVAHRAGHDLMGYPPYWVALTATHFHVAGLILPVVAGMHARRGGTAAAIAAWCVMLGVPATAIGIAWSRPVELAAALGVAAAAAWVAVMGLGAARRTRGAARALHAASAAALLGAMPLAAAYALRLDLRLGGLSALDTMAVTHGAANLAFATCALGALALAPPPPPWRAGIPLSRLRGGARIGADFFDRAGVVTAPASPPQGLVERMTDLGHAGFDAAAVAPAIARFYERTAEHDMVVRPRWRPGFGAGARVWSRLARRLGQLRLPVAAERGDEALSSRIVPLDAARDGRPGVRGWVRAFADGHAMYVAAYAVHRAGDDAYMNIAFPLPGGHMTSVLRCEPLAGGGVAVSTVRAGATRDTGIYLVLGGVAVRLPLGEEIRVWTPGMPGVPDELAATGADVVARHDVWLCGVRVVTLDYVISARRAAPAPTPR